MVTVRSVLVALAVVSACGVAAWLELAKGNTIAPAIDPGSSTAAQAATPSAAQGEVAPSSQPGRETVPAAELAPTSAAAAIESDRLRVLQTLRCFEPRKAYEVLRGFFDRDAHYATQLCEFAVSQVPADEAGFLGESLLSAVFAAWLDATGSPHAVLAATLHSIPAEVHGLVERQLLEIAVGLANRDAQLPPQPEAQQRALVHALVAASDHHADRLAAGLLVTCALGRAADHDPTAQAALTRLARSPEGRIQELAWSALATELPPSMLLPVVERPLPAAPDRHDTRRALAALRSIRNAPEQAAVVHRWLGLRLVELARQSRQENDPKQEAARVLWLELVDEGLFADDRLALQAELQVLADGQGELAERARRLLPPR